MTAPETAQPPCIEIAQAAEPRPIVEVAAELGLEPDEIEPYGHHKAKIPLGVFADASERGSLVLVTATNPTPAGEGKTTVTIGLAQALRRLGHSVVPCTREPSLGPLFGRKGGATGGGYAQVLPADEINLHFTGDTHAVTSAHMLLSAILDNQVHQGNPLDVEPRSVSWPRCVDLNDRALRRIVVGLGGRAHGVPREDGFVITAASEVMAILCLADDLADLERRLGEIIVGVTRDGSPVRARDLEVQGAMTLLLKEALKPNLVQTLEGGPAIVHGGPFGNIAQGCNSVVATRAALATADIVLSEAGFGSELGAEKFCDIKCRAAGFRPEAAVVVTSVRALKLNGGQPLAQLQTPDLEALERGMANLDKHVENVRAYGLPPVVAINRFSGDTRDELDAVIGRCERLDVPAAVVDVFRRGGEGGEALGEALLDVLARKEGDLRYVYELDSGIREKIGRIATRVYGASGVDTTPEADSAIEELERRGLDDLAICMAKTPFSLSDEAAALGRPTGFRITVRDIEVSAGAGFLVVLTGKVLRMPGLPSEPASARMRVEADGTVRGLE